MNKCFSVSTCISVGMGIGLYGSKSVSINFISGKLIQVAFQESLLGVGISDSVSL